MFRFSDPDFERSFYRDLFGVGMHDEDLRRNLDRALDPSNEIPQMLDEQPCQEPVSAG